MNDENEEEKTSGSEASARPSLLKSSDMAALSDYLAQSLGIREKPACKLASFDLEGVAKYLMSDQCNNVVTMAGAGISTSAGIPDFRSPGTGLYDNLASYNLPDPMAIFSIDYFRENPRPFFALAKELYPGVFKPTVCHYFIKLLSDKGKLLRHYTQNIDTLERTAGLDGDKIVEAHGTFHVGHCLECGMEFTQDWIKEEIFADKIPRCTEEGCHGVVKPDIVFFGERLPDRFISLVDTDLKKCDLLIIMGTSLQVQPFASLTSRVPLSTPRLYINLEPGMTTEELREIVATEHAKIDQAKAREERSKSNNATASSPKAKSNNATTNSPKVKPSTATASSPKAKSNTGNAKSQQPSGAAATSSSPAAKSKNSVGPTLKKTSSKSTVTPQGAKAKSKTA